MGRKQFAWQKSFVGKRAVRQPNSWTYLPQRTLKPATSEKQSGLPCKPTGWQFLQISRTWLRKFAPG